MDQNLSQRGEPILFEKSPSARKSQQNSFKVHNIPLSKKLPKIKNFPFEFMSFK